MSMDSQPRRVARRKTEGAPGEGVDVSIFSDDFLNNGEKALEDQIAQNSGTTFQNDAAALDRGLEEMAPFLESVEEDGGSQKRSNRKPPVRRTPTRQAAQGARTEHAEVTVPTPRVAEPLPELEAEAAQETRKVSFDSELTFPVLLPEHETKSIRNAYGEFQKIRGKYIATLGTRGQHARLSHAYDRAREALFEEAERFAAFEAHVGDGLPPKTEWKEWLSVLKKELFEGEHLVISEAREAYVPPLSKVDAFIDERVEKVSAWAKGLFKKREAEPHEEELAKEPLTLSVDDPFAHVLLPRDVVGETGIQNQALEGLEREFNAKRTAFLSLYKRELRKEHLTSVREMVGGISRDPAKMPSVHAEYELYVEAKKNLLKAAVESLPKEGRNEKIAELAKIFGAEEELARNTIRREALEDNKKRELGHYFRVGSQAVFNWGLNRLSQDEEWKNSMRKHAATAAIAGSLLVTFSVGLYSGLGIVALTPTLRKLPSALLGAAAAGTFGDKAQEYTGRAMRGWQELVYAVYKQGGELKDKLIPKRKRKGEILGDEDFASALADIDRVEKETRSSLSKEDQEAVVKRWARIGLGGALGLAGAEIGSALGHGMDSLGTSLLHGHDHGAAIPQHEVPHHAPQAETHAPASHPPLARHTVPAEHHAAPEHHAPVHHEAPHHVTHRHEELAGGPDAPVRGDHTAAFYATPEGENFQTELLQRYELWKATHPDAVIQGELADINNSALPREELMRNLEEFLSNNP